MDGERGVMGGQAGLDARALLESRAAGSALGPRKDWPQALRTAVDLMMASKFPMFVVWGEARTIVYNGAYIPILGRKHPAAMARPFYEVWAEIRDDVGPLLERAYAGEASYLEDMHLVMERGGFMEETYFTFSYSPLPDGDGGIAGMFCACTETTQKVLTNRRQEFLVTLEARLRELADPRAIIGAAQAMLGEHLGVSRVGYGEVDETARFFTTDQNWTDGTVAHNNGVHDLAGFGPEVLAALRRGETLVVHDVARDPRTNSPEALAAFAFLETQAVLTVTLVKGGRMRAALYVHHREPRVFSGNDVRLVHEVAERTWSALQRAIAEEALRASEAQFRTFAQVMPAQIWAGRPDGVLDWFNDRVYEYTGAREGELYGDRWGGFLHPDDFPASSAAWRQSVATGELYQAEFRIRRHDGAWRWYLSRARPIRNAEGAIERWVGANTDIEDQRAAAQALANLNNTLEKQVEERTRELDRIWKLSRDPFVISDANGVWLRASPAWTEILGYDINDFLGRTSAWVEHPDDLERSDEERERLANGKATLRFENRFRARDGTYRWFAWNAVPHGGLVYNVARDVTAEKEAAESLHRAEEALRQAQKMEAVGQLTGGIAHDFNNLLTGIIGSLDVVQRRIASGRVQDLDRFMDAAVASANRAAGLTHRLLAFSRRQSLDLKPVDVNGLVASMEDLLRRTLGENTRVVTRLNATWPAESDTNQLETALLNLAINARDAMPGGGELTVTTADVTVAAGDLLNGEGLEPGGYVLLSVGDTGMGMARDVIQRAFDPFFTTKPIGQGTGLGLSMIYGFAKQARGHVAIESEVGRGATVRLYMPCSPQEPQEKPADGVGQLEAGAGEVVLVVEDDAAVRQLVTEVLNDLGYQAIEATDGRAAVPILQSGQRIDLLITDVGLPGMNGRQIADIGRGERPGLKVLFITGYAEHAAIRGGFLDEGMEMVTKPFSLDQLASQIRAMIAAPAAG